MGICGYILFLIQWWPETVKAIIIVRVTKKANADMGNMSFEKCREIFEKLEIILKNREQIKQK